MNTMRSTIGSEVPMRLALADPTVTLSANKEIVTPGDSVIVTLIVTNNGQLPATGVVITDSFPTQLDVASASAGQGTFTVDGNTVVFAVGLVNPSQSVAFSIVTQANLSVVPPVDAVNSAILSYADGLNRESNSVTVHITRGMLPSTGEHPENSTPLRFVLLGGAGALSGCALGLRLKRRTTRR